MKPGIHILLVLVVVPTPAYGFLTKPSLGHVPFIASRRTCIEEEDRNNAAHLHHPPLMRLSLSTSSTSEGAASSLQEQITSNLNILAQAAETKDVDSDTVCAALSDLEKQMRQRAKDDPNVAIEMRRMLSGDWRLIFTTGTGETQKKYGKINYFPLKAVQSFRTIDCDPMTIENGIYVGDFPLIRFSGTMEFDLKKRRLEFDFDRVLVLSFFDIKLGKGEAARLGSSSGLGSDSNVKNAEKGRNAFFNWISADETIATARGAGGGLALWKRVQ